MGWCEVFSGFGVANDFWLRRWWNWVNLCSFRSFMDFDRDPWGCIFLLRGWWCFGLVDLDMGMYL